MMGYIEIYTRETEETKLSNYSKFSTDITSEVKN